MKSIFVTCWQKVIALKIRTFQKSVSATATKTQQPAKLKSSMETITAAANVQHQLAENNLTTYKGHDDDDDDKLEHQSIDGVLDENQENSVDNRQCQSQCVRYCRKLSNNKIQTTQTDHQPQLCNCEQNGDSIMANATNGLNHLNVNNQNNTNWTTAPATTESIKTNGFHHRSNKENTISAKPEEMDVCEYSQQIYGGHLTNLVDATRDGTLDVMVSSDLSNTELTLADKKCTTEFIVTDNTEQQNGCNHVIDKGHRRTRARSESDQCDFYETRKQRMCREAKHESDVSINY